MELKFVAVILLGCLLGAIPFGVIATRLARGGMLLTRYASVGSIIGLIGSFLAMLFLVLLGRQPVEYSIYAGVAGGLILFQHRDNIQRLRTGKERRLGEKAEVE